MDFDVLLTLCAHSSLNSLPEIKASSRSGIVAFLNVYLKPREKENKKTNS